MEEKGIKKQIAKGESKLRKGQFRKHPFFERVITRKRLTTHQIVCYRNWQEFNVEYDVRDEVPDAIADRLNYTRPEPPEDPRTIQGWDLPYEEQKFPYYSEEEKKKWVFYMDESKKDKHEEYLKFIAEEWRRRREGFFFFNGGRLEYITGHHYMFLQYWLIPVEKDGRKITANPDFRDVHRTIFYAIEAARKDKRCYGLLYYSMRRIGKTAIGLADGFFDTTAHRVQKMTVQSKNDTDGKLVFEKLKASWKSLPAFFKPNDSKDENPMREIKFSQKGSVSEIEEREYSNAYIDGSIRWDGAKETTLDGNFFSYIFTDEVGKSLGLNTMCRMYDGSTKKIQDICIGDKVLNPDGVSTVVDLVRGRGKMYRVIPNSSNEFTCNEAHDLILKWASKRQKLSFKGKKYGFGEQVVMEVRDYLNLSNHSKKHLMLFRKELNYKKRELPLSPYYLGAWLGDGYSNTAAVCGVDFEVLNEVRKVNEKYSIRTERKGDGKIKVVVVNPYNTIGTLKKLGVHKNKHIPDIYLHNSRDNRLELLAGLLDTDGTLNSKNGFPSNYEITQKNELIADGIVELVNGLGLKARKSRKIAKMKRADGKIYSSTVFRVFIYGDLNEIPCRVKRKQAGANSQNKNRRNPMRSGFNIEYIGRDDFYGFKLDRNPEFYLKDGTIVHNCDRGLDVNERWNINKECLGEGTKIVGFSYVTSTIEDMKKYASKEAEILWDRSNPNETDPILDRTDSGLYRLFLPAYYGFQGEDGTSSFVDEYGYSDIKRAYKYVKSMYEFKKGDDLLSFRRKYPITIDDSFALSDSGNNFSKEKIFQQQNHNRNLSTNPMRKGNFIWERGERDSKVVFVPDPNGKWEVSWIPKEEDRNKWQMKGTQRFPTRDFGRMGIDPFDQSHTEYKGSDAAAVTVVNHPEIGNGAVVCVYRYRQQYAEHFFEDMIMQSVFYSTYVLTENNKSGVLEHFRRRGYDGFQLKDPLEKDQKKMLSPKKGISTTDLDKIQTMIDNLQAFIYDNIGLNDETGQYGWCPHEELLKDWLRFEPDRRTKYDLTMASLMATTAFRNRREVVKVRRFESIGDWFTTYK